MLICCCGLFTEFTPENIESLFKNEMRDRLSETQCPWLNDSLVHITPEEIRRVHFDMVTRPDPIYTIWNSIVEDRRIDKIIEIVEPLLLGGLETQLFENDELVSYWMPAMATAA